MTSDHANARHSFASQFRSKYLASDRGNRHVIYMDRYVWFFIFFEKKKKKIESLPNFIVWNYVGSHIRLFL